MKRRKIWMILGSFSLILALSFLLLGGHAEAQAKKAAQPIKWVFATNPGPAANTWTLLSLSALSEAPGKEFRRAARPRHQDGTFPGE